MSELKCNIATQHYILAQTSFTFSVQRQRERERETETETETKRARERSVEGWVWRGGFIVLLFFQGGLLFSCSLVVGPPSGTIVWNEIS